jgi:hypothetical protein
MEDKDTMPAGAMPPEKEAEPKDEGQPEPILGKFKSQDELAQAYSELEKKIGEQGNELGSMKQMNAMMLEQMQARQAQDQTPATEGEKDDFDFDASMLELKKGVEEGDIPFEQALEQSANLAAQKATREAMSQYENMTAKQQQQAAQEKFLTDHPDFVELQRSGELEKVKQSLPGMHDDFSAYFALRAEQAIADAQEKQALDTIAQGDERTGKVLQKPGAKAKDIGKPKGKLSPAELKKHTLARLEAME